MNGVEAWFRQLYASTGLNFSYMYDAYDRARFFHGLEMTIELAAITVAAGIPVGIIGAWMLGSSSAFPRNVAKSYVQIFRNTPPLVQLYFFYFGVSTLLPVVRDKVGLQTPLFSGFTWACISLTAYVGSFNVEIFRSGIEAIPSAMIEAAEALGYRRLQTFRQVVLPLAFRICLPALTNNLVNAVKATTLAYAIAIPELLYTSTQIWTDNGNVPEMMATLLVIYLLLISLMVGAMHWLERALRCPGLGT